MNRALLTSFVLLCACDSPAVVTESARPLACDPADPPGELQERASFSGRANFFRLGRCGEVLYLEPSGDLYRTGPALAAPERVAEGASSVTVSELGDQLIVQELDGDRVHLDLASGESTPMPDGQGGFVRLGEEQIVWACADNQLGRLDASGFSPMVDNVLCERVYPATQAPVIAFVDADDVMLRVLRLDDGTVLDLSEVPYIAVQNDTVQLSRDGTYLFHQPARSPVPRIGIFDLARGEGDRYLGAPESWTRFEAPRAGHASAFPTEEGDLVILTENRLLNLYRSVQLISLAPDGSSALLAYPLDDSLNSYTIAFARLPGTSVENIQTVRGGIGWQAASQDGRYTIVGATFGGVDRTVIMVDWEDGAVTSREDLAEYQSVTFVSNHGTVIARNILGEFVFVGGPDTPGVPLTQNWLGGTWSTADGVVAWIQESESPYQRLVSFSDAAEPTEIYRGDQLWTVQVDESGERMMYLTVEPDAANPGQQLTRMFYGATPSH